MSNLVYVLCREFPHDTSCLEILHITSYLRKFQTSHIMSENSQHHTSSLHVRKFHISILMLENFSHHTQLHKQIITET